VRLSGDELGDGRCRKLQRFAVPPVFVKAGLELLHVSGAGRERAAKGRKDTVVDELAQPHAFAKGFAGGQHAHRNRIVADERPVATEAMQEARAKAQIELAYKGAWLRCGVLWLYINITTMHPGNGGYWRSRASGTCSLYPYCASSSSKYSRMR
jgi:hypothetical protein